MKRSRIQWIAAYSRPSPLTSAKTRYFSIGPRARRLHAQRKRRRAHRPSPAQGWVCRIRGVFPSLRERFGRWHLYRAGGSKPTNCTKPPPSVPDTGIFRCRRATPGHLAQAKGVLPGDIPIRGAQAQHCATVWPGNKVCRVCGSHLAVRVNGLNAASALTCAGLLGKRKVRTLVRTGFCRFAPRCAQKRPGTKTQCWRGLQPIRCLGCRNRPTSLCARSDASDTG